jgi:hypothetical protein
MSYSFLRESKLYIEYSGIKYRIYTSSAISFNQTFAEDSYSVKTLHDQSKMFEGSSITKANPASFSIEVPLTIEKNESIMLTLATDLETITAESDIEPQKLKTFQIYVQTGNTTWKLENAVITSAVMDFIPENPFTLRLEGEGTKLTRVGDESYSIPCDSTFTESSTRTPLIVYPSITLGGTAVENIISCNLQIANSIEWNPYTTLHSSLSVTNSSNAMFPTDFILDKRIVSGEIRQYHTNNNYNDHDDFSTSTSLAITGKNVSGDTDFFTITINPAVYTSRVDPSEVYTTSYDFRSADNTDTLGTQISVYS